MADCHFVPTAHTMSIRTLTGISTAKATNVSFLFPDMSTDLEGNVDESEEGLVNSPSSFRVSRKSFVANSHSFCIHKRSHVQFNTPKHQPANPVHLFSPTRHRKPVNILGAKGSPGKQAEAKRLLSEKLRLMPCLASCARSRSRSLGRMFNSTLGQLPRSSTTASSSGTTNSKKSPAKPVRERRVSEEEEQWMYGPVANTRLFAFWERKQALEEKYRKLLCDLEVEEASELNLRIGKVRPETVEDEISGLKIYYQSVKALIGEQRILEEEDLVREYQNRLQDGNLA